MVFTCIFISGEMNRFLEVMPLRARNFNKFHCCSQTEMKFQSLCGIASRNQFHFARNENLVKHHLNSLLYHRDIICYSSFNVKARTLVNTKLKNIKTDFHVCTCSKVFQLPCLSLKMTFLVFSLYLT